MKKKLLVLIIATGLIAPALIFALENTQSLNTTCWKKDECLGVNGAWEESGKSLQWNATTKKYENKACESGTGLCLSKTPDIDLQVDLPIEGGVKSSVSGFSEYLSIFYKFFVAMIAVMSVVMIMWGGFKLIYRAGSGPAVTDAKETIFGAIAALVIALLSYSLLNLVNPQLVLLPELRIPKIKPESFGIWCPRDVLKNNSPVICGDKTVLDSGDECVGQSCAHVGAGICYFESNLSSTPVCGSFLAQGNILWQNNAYVDYMWLAAVCGNNTVETVSLQRINNDGTTQTGRQSIELDLEENADGYILGNGFLQFQLDDSSICGGGVRGFVILAEVNDDRTPINYTQLGQTCDDVFAIGKAGSSCGPLSPKVYGDIEWDKIPNSALLQITDFPLAPQGLQRDACIGGSNNGQACYGDADCPREKAGGVPATCTGLTSYVSCDLRINRQQYPANDSDNNWLVGLTGICL